MLPKLSEMDFNTILLVHGIIFLIFFIFNIILVTVKPNDSESKHFANASGIMDAFYITLSTHTMTCCNNSPQTTLAKTFHMIHKIIAFTMTWLFLTCKIIKISGAENVGNKLKTSVVSTTLSSKLPSPIPSPNPSTVSSISTVASPSLIPPKTTKIVQQMNDITSLIPPAK